MPTKRSLAGGVAIGALLLLSTVAGHAQTAPSVQKLERQIQQLQDNYTSQIQDLQNQLNQMKAAQRAQAEQTQMANQRAQEAQVQAQAAAKASASSGGLSGTYHVGGVTLKVGGFIEAASIYRSSNETADVGSNFSTGIPFSANNNDHTSEFRESARQSRLSLLANGNPDAATGLTAYFESDFLGAAPTANSNESNSYNLRLRQAFTEYDRSDWGFSLIGGQTWSLATLYTSGLTPRKEAVPLTIDAQYNVGFNWMRVPGIRLVENFAPGWWAGLSFENPQALVYGGANGVPGVLVGNPGTGGGLLNNGGTYCSYTNGTSCGEGYTGTAFTFDVMPDIILKLAAEPGWGHYEIYGLAREFRTENTCSGGPTNCKGLDLIAGSHPTAFGGGIGAGAVLPVVPTKVDVTLNGLVGKGVGKYASGQLPDFTINPNNGAPAPIGEATAMVGVIGHPTTAWDLYGYLGIEEAQKQAYTGINGTAYGYGNSAYTNGPTTASTTGSTGAAAGCLVGNVGGTTIIDSGVYNTGGQGCNIRQLWQAQVGAWYKFYQGDFGMMELGASYSHVHVGTFSGTAGSPTTSDNIVMTSFRYYPF
jgi:TolA-binding protein